MGYPTRFGEFRRALASLAKVPAVISQPVADGIQKIVKRNFRQGVDPYGNAYEPLTPGSIARGRRNPPLRKFANVASVRPLGPAGVAVTVAHPQAGFHQTGTTHMAKRIVFPDRDVPAEWKAIIEREFKKAIRLRMQGAA